jgi:hypothetical protein
LILELEIFDAFTGAPRRNGKVVLSSPSSQHRFPDDPGVDFACNRAVETTIKKHWHAEQYSLADSAATGAASPIRSFTTKPHAMTFTAGAKLGPYKSSP